MKGPQRHSHRTRNKSFILDGTPLSLDESFYNEIARGVILFTVISDFKYSHIN